MIREITFDRKNKRILLTIKESNGFPIYYKDFITKKELQEYLGALK